MLCAVSMVLAGSSRATPITDTFTGTVSSGTDSAGVFGGGSLVGDAFTGTVTFDPAKLNYQVNSSDEAYTGGAAGAFTITATINNITVTSTHLVELVAQQGAPGDTQLTLDGSSPELVFEFEALGNWVAGEINTPLVLDSSNSNQNVFVSGDGPISIAPSAVQSSPAPEPASLAIFGTSLIALRVGRRRRRG